MKHVETQALWVQQANDSKQIAFTKVPGTANPSEMLTKHVPAEILDRHMAKYALDEVLTDGGLYDEEQLCAIKTSAFRR